MDISEILSKVDHTLLSRTAAWEDIRRVCDEGIRYRTASVCIPPSFVARAREYAGEGLVLCTVIGFPNGYSTAAAKVFEASQAVRDGADELDMVIDLGLVKDGRWDGVLSEIEAVKEVCGERILKVIIETCLLTDEEKVRLCQIVSRSGADFIKTSTGFAGGGATREDVALLAANVEPHVRVKAAGGIASLEDAEDFLRLGAARLGTSKIVAIATEKQNEVIK